MPTPKRLTLPPVPAVMAAVLSVQGGATMAKGLFPVLGAAGTAGIRIVLSALMVLAVFRPPLGRMTAHQWRAVVPYGVVLGTMNTTFYLAIERIPLGLGVTLEFIGPLGVAVFGSRRPLDLLWVALAAAGIALIAPWSGGAVDPVGVGLALVAGACWAAYILLGGRLSRVLSGGAAVGAGMIVASLVVIPFVVATGGLHHLTPRLAVEGAVLALLSSALPYTLEMRALRELPARTFGILMSTEPAVAALCGLAFLGERLTPSQWGAIALVIAASAGVTATGKKTEVAADV